jgi:hypothetical protein
MDHSDDEGNPIDDSYGPCQCKDGFSEQIVILINKSKPDS